MDSKTYDLIELAGASEASSDQAIRSSVARAAETLKGLDWFEVQQVRGTITNGQVGEFQVDFKIGFRLMSRDELNTDQARSRPAGD